MMRFIARIRNSSFTLPLFFLVSALCLQAGNFLNQDEGTILNGAWKLYSGQKLYQDFFSFIPPGSYFFTKWSFDLLGPSYWSAKLFSVLFLLASTYALYGIALMAFARRRVAIASAWLWVFLSFFPIPVLINYNTHSTYTALITVFFLARAVTRHKKADYFLAGIFTGITALFLHSKGLFLAGSIGAFLFLLIFRKKIPVSSFFLFGAGVLAPLLSAISVFGWRTLYEHLVVWPAEHYSAVNETSWLPFLGAALLFAFLARRSARAMQGNRSVLALVCIVQGALLLSVWHRPDLSHMIWNMFGILLLGVHFVADVYERSQSPVGHALRKIVDDRFLSAAFISFFIAVPLAINMLSLSSERAFREKVVRNHITSFYAHPFLPGMYFEFGIPDPYPYDVLISGIHPTEAFESNLAQLKKEDPPYVLADYAVVAKFNYNAGNTLDRYILSHYSFLEQWGSVTVLKRSNP